MNAHCITLIGMPAVGKSTIGKALANRLKWRFVDTDTILIRRIGMPLQDYIDHYGSDQLSREEDAAVLSLQFSHNTVISTGGSVVYHDDAMRFLKAHSKIVYLYDRLENIRARMHNLDQRGITGLAEKGLDGLYAERSVLYERYMDHKIEVYPFHKDDIVDSITSVLELGTKWTKQKKPF